MCCVSSQLRSISFPLQEWVTAGICMFSRCRFAENKLNVSTVFSLLLSKNGCCNAAQRKGWGYTVRSLRQFHTRTAATCRTLCLLHLQVNRLNAAVCWVTAVTCERRPKTHLVSDLTFPPPAPRDANRADGVYIWITDPHLRPDKVTTKAKSSWDPRHNLA